MDISLKERKDPSIKLVSSMALKLMRVWKVPKTVQLSRSVEHNTTKSRVGTSFRFLFFTRKMMMARLVEDPTSVNRRFRTPMYS